MYITLILIMINMLIKHVLIEVKTKLKLDKMKFAFIFLYTLSFIRLLVLMQVVIDAENLNRSE